MSGANVRPQGRNEKEMSGAKVPKQIEKILAKNATPSRRTFLKSAGLLAVSLSAGAGVESALAAQAPGAAAAAPAGPYPDPNYKQLDSWIVIHQDNTATFFVGKTDCGQGT